MSPQIRLVKFANLTETRGVQLMSAPTTTLPVPSTGFYYSRSYVKPLKNATPACHSIWIV